MSLQRRFKKSEPSTIPAVASKVPTGVHNEQHYGVSELAKKWGVSDDTLRPIFMNEHGVLKIVRPEDVRKKKRRYVNLRIPASVAARVHERLHGKIAA